jgi:hypothetical protein
MACELGMNPAKLGNHRQDPWKLPLPQFIEALYVKRFGKTAPDRAVSLEERARVGQYKKVASCAAKQQRSPDEESGRRARTAGEPTARWHPPTRKPRRVGKKC